MAFTPTLRGCAARNSSSCGSAISGRPNQRLMTRRARSFILRSCARRRARLPPMNVVLLFQNC
jgi:hypothetical protein